MENQINTNSNLQSFSGEKQNIFSLFTQNIQSGWEIKWLSLVTKKFKFSGIWTLSLFMFSMISCNFDSSKVHYANLMPNEGIMQHNGQPFNGTAFGTYPDGTIKKLVEYKDGVKHGDYQTFYKNGKRNTLGYHKDGRKDKEWIYTNKEGKLIRKREYVDGVSKSTVNY